MRAGIAAEDVFCDLLVESRENMLVEDMSVVLVGGVVVVVVFWFSVPDGEIVVCGWWLLGCLLW